MKIVSNEKVIARNSRAGFWATLLYPVVIALGALTLLSPQGNGFLAVALIALGLVFRQASLTLTRYGRGADLSLNETLKKLDDQYTLYHFSTPVSHLLVGQAGIWILLPRYVQGRVTFDEKRDRWKLERLKRQGLRGLFAEGIGRPDMEIVAEAGSLDRYLQKRWTSEDSPYLQAAIVLMDPKSEAATPNAPIPTVHLSKLREFIRQKEKDDKTSAAGLQAFKDALNNA